MSPNFDRVTVVLIGVLVVLDCLVLSELLETNRTLKRLEDTNRHFNLHTVCLTSRDENDPN